MNRKLFLLLPIFMFLGCGPSEIAEGTVTNKYFEPGHYENQEYPEFDFEGNFVGLSSSEVWIEDRWYVVFSNNDNEQNETRCRRIKVIQETFDRHKIGDWIEFDE